MSEPKWTPGPWRIQTVQLRGSWLMAKEETLAEILDPRAGPCAEESNANANLIAAAPDLYSALQFILAFYEPGQRYLDTNSWKQAEAGARHAMAKARGETQ